MKKAIYPALCALILSACTVGTPGMSVGVGLGTHIGSHLGLGTSLNIPVSLNKTGNGEHSQSGGVNVVDEQIVTYFDAQGNTSNSPVKGGFYRQLISKRNGSEYVVQDFYSDNSRKRTDPYTLSRAQLLQFRANPENGSLTTYAYNGNVMQQQIYQNGKLVNARY